MGKTIEITSTSDCPIGANLNLSRPESHVTTSRIRYRRGKHKLDVERAFYTDFASIPRLLWWISGFAPLDRETWLAAVAHDWNCVHDELDRWMGDVLFVVIMRGPATFNGRPLPRVSLWRALAMYAAVRANSIYQGWKKSQEIAELAEAGDEGQDGRRQSN
jgi:hypothetical protein